MASGTWFGETSRQSQAKPVKQQHTGNFTKPRTRSHTLLSKSAATGIGDLSELPEEVCRHGNRDKDFIR